MKTKLIYKVMACLIAVLTIMNLKCIAYAQEESISSKEIVVIDGEQKYGELYGDKYSDTDDSKWLTLKLEERGLRIVNKDGNDVVLVDQFGSVYVNGVQVGIEEEKTNNTQSFSFGFMYFLVVVSILLGIVNLLMIKHKSIN